VGCVPPQQIEYRTLRQRDVEAAARLISSGFEGYREFAPAGWQPPAMDQEIQGLQPWVDDEDFYGELAFHGDVIVGHAAFLPAPRHRSRPVPDPGLIHLSYLFVAPPYWGCDAAPALLRRAMSAAHARGFAAMRLFTPAGQRRARRFYEREGFQRVGQEQDLGLALPTLEYRVTLTA